MDEFITIFLGALIGFILPYLIKFIIYLFKRFFPTPVCGEWKSYIWWTNNGKIELCAMNAIIKRGILYQYNVTFSDSTSLYRGTACIEDNNLCISMNSCDPILKASTFHRYELSTGEKRNRLFGFWLSFDGDKRVSCGGSILAKDNIDTASIANIIQTEYRMAKDVPLMTLKK